MEDEIDNLAGEDDDLFAPERAGEVPQEDLFELELDGQVHTLPGALKGAFLRQADYTRKTQELAEHRRAAEAERRALTEQRRTMGQESQDRITLAALDHQLEDFEGVDWEAYAAEDPQSAQALWGRYQHLAQARERLAYAVSHHESRRSLEAAREAAEQMAETGRTLQREIDGWSPEIANKLVEYAQAFGVTLEELSQMADPRLWKVLHKAYQADQATQADGVAKSAAQAQAVRPAVLVSGAAAGGGGVRDELATKEWMARRNAQMTKGR